MLRSWSRRAFAISAMSFLAACSGGGCSKGCGGMTPLPGGFPADKTVDNGAAVRITRPGLDFVQSQVPSIAAKLLNAKNGVYTITIPETDLSKTKIFSVPLTGPDFYLIPHICVGGPKPNATPPECVATVSIGTATFRIDSVKPSSVVLTGTIPLKLTDTEVKAEIDPGPDITVHVGYGDGGCKDGSPDVVPHKLPVTVTVPLVEEGIAPRQGYTKVDVANARVNLDGLVQDDVQICGNCGSLLSGVCSGITNSSLIKGFIVDKLKSTLNDQIKGILEDQLCTKPNTDLNPPCPDRSKPDSKNEKCVYLSQPSVCVPTLLGMDSHVDLSGALKKFSPTTSGGLDFVLASGGKMTPYPNANADSAGKTTNGITLAMKGGALPNPTTNCVPVFDNPAPTGIPVPDELTQDKITPWPSGTTGPHVGIALSGRFLNYAVGNVYNSGLLCLGVSTDQVAELNSGLLSLLIPSVKKLALDGSATSVAISTRPQAPPELKLGGGTDVKSDPLVSLTLPKFTIDFYVWSYDRYVRAFTFTGDVVAPVNLQTTKNAKNPNGGLVPTVGQFTVTNAEVTNSELLLEDPATIASSLSSILTDLVGQFLGSGFGPFDFSSALDSYGLALTIPEGSIRKLTKGQDDFLGIFANLSKSTNATVESQTTLALTQKRVNPEAMTLAAFDRAKLPELDVTIGSSLAKPKNGDEPGTEIEYSYWFDNGFPSAWSTSAPTTIKDSYLYLQGKHVLHVTSRIKGVPESEDSTPAEAPFIIDVLPPTASIEQTTDGHLAFRASDFVSHEEDLTARVKFDNEAWSEWQPVAAFANIAAIGRTVYMEVKDEEGNIGQVSQALRGRSDGTLGTASSSCSCTTVKSTSSGRVDLAAGLLSIAGIFGFGLRRRAKKKGSVNGAAFAVGAISVVAAITPGCDCGSADREGYGMNSCGPDCNQECQPGLPQGIVGAYTSAAVANDGSVWVSGYNDSAASEGIDLAYGDLAVGRYDSGKSAVQWESVDGFATRESGVCGNSDPNGWRQGQDSAGDNVGLWTSIQLTGDGKPMVSYYDATHFALKFAFKNENGWSNYTLKAAPNADFGRYSKMIMVDGKPVIAFLGMEAGDKGHLRSRVIVARANTEFPTDPGNWTLEDAAVDEGGPCRPSFCTNAQVCVKDTGSCTDTVKGCTPEDCGSGNACVKIGDKATCSEVVAAQAIESYPNAFGAYISLANGKDGIGIVVYDRIRGNLVGISSKDGWKQTILDGEAGSRADKTAVDTGDTGIGASLSISEDGTWHVTYVSGLDETLRYLAVQGGKPTKSQIIDDGSKLGGIAFTDGKHIVGDDSFVKENGGTVTVAYQDATAGTLRIATGTGDVGSRKWELRDIKQEGKFAGYFPRILPDSRVVNFWRTANAQTKEIAGDVAIVGP